MTSHRTVRATLLAMRTRLANDEAAREAELLLAHVLGRDRAWLYAHADAAVDAAAQERAASAVARRAAGEPLAYVTGRREFWSLDLAVDARVLIPRADTETLVERALQHVPQDEPMDIADLGTGSGAIALALARERPRTRVLGTDASAPALELAQANARRLALANVEFARGDWCAALGTRRFGLIVSNPPYIAAGDPHLGQGDLRFEPPAALVSGRDGLDAIRAIAGCAPAHLRRGGWLLLEHGFDQGAAVRALLAARGFGGVFTARDLGQRERVSGGRFDAA